VTVSLVLSACKWCVSGHRRGPAARSHECQSDDSHALHLHEHRRRNSRGIYDIHTTKTSNSAKCLQTGGRVTITRTTEVMKLNNSWRIAALTFFCSWTNMWMYAVWSVQTSVYRMERLLHEQLLICVLAFTEWAALLLYRLGNLDTAIDIRETALDQSCQRPMWTNPPCTGMSETATFLRCITEKLLTATFDYLSYRTPK